MIEYRVMTIADYEEVYELWQNALETTLSGANDSRSGIEKYLNRNPKTSFVALDGRKIVGAILAGHDGRRGFIGHLAVLSEYRRQKIASMLVSKAKAALREEGIRKAVLLVKKDNTAGNSFWDNMQFQIREDIFYRDTKI